MPKIAQKKLDQAKLNLKSIVVTNTQSQNYTMAIDSTIEADDSVHADIDGFKGQMYLEDFHPHTSFAEIDFPPTTSSAEQTVSVSQFTPITDLEAFTIFNTWLLINDTLRVTVEGDTKIKVKGISKKFDVTFKKTITMPGKFPMLPTNNPGHHCILRVCPMLWWYWFVRALTNFPSLGLRSFNGTTVSQSRISLEADDDGNNFHGFVSIPNYSLVTFEIVSESGCFGASTLICFSIFRLFFFSSFFFFFLSRPFCLNHSSNSLLG